MLMISLFSLGGLKRKRKPDRQSVDADAPSHLRAQPCFVQLESAPPSLCSSPAPHIPSLFNAMKEKKSRLPATHLAKPYSRVVLVGLVQGQSTLHVSHVFYAVVMLFKQETEKPTLGPDIANKCKSAVSHDIGPF